MYDCFKFNFMIFFDQKYVKQKKKKKEKKKSFNKGCALNEKKMFSIGFLERKYKKRCLPKRLKQY